MAITYKRLTEKELDTFIAMRINQLREEGAKEDIDLTPNLKDFYNRHMADGTFVAWLAMDGETIIGTSGMSFVEKPPYFGCPSGKIGLLSSMFTSNQYRRQGVRRRITIGCNSKLNFRLTSIRPRGLTGNCTFLSD